jgi:hypothetical protein
LRAIDKDGLYEQVCTRAEQCLTSLVEKAR